MKIRAKIIVSLFFVTMLISGGVTGFSYWLLQNSLLEEFRSHLKNIAYIGAATIDIPSTQRLFEVRAPIVSKDEIGNLSQSFNSMAQTIDGYAKHLEQWLVAYGRFIPHSCDLYWDDRPTEDEIRHLAYQLWQNSHNQQDNALEHWLQARKQLIDKLRNS